MTKFNELSADEQMKSLTTVAQRILGHYELNIIDLTVINHGFNTTFSIHTPDQRFALRLNVNSRREVANVKAEIEWMSHLSDRGVVSLPRVVPTSQGETYVVDEGIERGRAIVAVLFTWLDGTIVAQLDDATDALRAAGAAMARLHLDAANFEMPAGARLPRRDAMWWGFPIVLTGSTGVLASGDHELVERCHAVIQSTVADLYRSEPIHIIHADLHGGNLMWNNGELSLFDFEDCAIGTPTQDLAASLFYLRDPAHRVTLMQGYRTVAELPFGSERELSTLVLQRQLILLNYFAGTENPEHRGIFEGFLQHTRTAMEDFLP